MNATLIAWDMWQRTGVVKNVSMTNSIHKEEFFMRVISHKCVNDDGEKSFDAKSISREFWAALMQ